jgi:hypothetical protein
MRCLAITALALLSTPALADSHSSGGTGGALGRTNSGIGDAVSSSQSSSSSSNSSSNGGSSSGGSSWQGSDPDYYNDSPTYVSTSSSTVTYLPEEEEEVEDYYTGDRARFAGYLGLQKVHDSDGSGTVELSVTDYRFRLSGAMSHYVEDQGDGGRTTLTLPSVMLGVRLTGRGNTQLFVDGGVSVAISRGAPAMDTSITAPTVGAQVVRFVNPKLALVADARAMWFQHDVTAVAGKVGIKFGHAQVSMRVLDFNVGPALWGPEVGLAF